MFDHLLAPIAPHLCCGCSKIGSLLCDNCNYNISSEPFERCVSCGSLAGLRGLCESCHLPYSRAWCVGERSGELRRLIDTFKFERVRGAHSPLAKLLSRRIGQLPEDTVLVPIPTIAPHIRQRGYDHALLLAKAVANYQGVPLSKVLCRKSVTRQRGATRVERIAQAEQAFSVRGAMRQDRVYVIIDDIITTGATVKQAAQALREAGAGDVWVAALAWQPLD